MKWSAVDQRSPMSGDGLSDTDLWSRNGWWTGCWFIN